MTTICLCLSVVSLEAASASTIPRGANELIPDPDSNRLDSPITFGIEDVTVSEDSPNTPVSLFDAFDDPEDPDSQLQFSVDVENPDLFTSTNVNQGNGNLVLNYAPDANGTSNITVQATDTEGLSVSTTFLVTVLPVNDEPSFSAGGNQTVDAGGSLETITNWATNIDPGAANESTQVLTFSVTPASSNLFSIPPTISSNGTLTFQPAANTSGTATFNVVLSDNGGTSNGGDDTSPSQSFSITVNNQNLPPTTTGIQNVDGFEDDDLVTRNLFSAFDDAEDADSELEYTIEQNTNPGLFVGGNPVVNPSAGTLTLIFQTNAFGDANLTVRATDTGGLFVETSFTVTLAPVNDAPSFTPGGNVTVREDSPQQTERNWATNLSPGPSNESEQTLEFSVTNTNNQLFTVQPSINTNGALTYTPAPNAFGDATIFATLKDSGGTENGGTDTSLPSTFIISITPVNDPPVVANDNYSLEESTTLTAFTGGNPPGVLDNDSDADGDVLTATVVESPQFSSSFSFVPNGSFTYEHDGSENLVDTFKYQVTDGTVTSPEVTVTITITPQNDPPVAGTIEDIRLNEDSPDTAIDLFAAFDDPDHRDNELEFSVVNVSNPALFDDLGNSSINQSTGTLTLDFLFNANGTSTVTVAAEDPLGASASLTFDVDLLPVNDAPSMTIGGTIEIREDAGPQTFEDWATNISSGPPNESIQTVSGAITSNSNPSLFGVQPVFTISGSTGTLTFTPAPQVSGVSEITITLMDTGGITNGGSNSQTYDFAIVVLGDNDPPMSAGIPDQTILEGATIPTFNLYEVFDDVEDPDEALTFSLEGSIDSPLFDNVEISGDPPLLFIEVAPDSFGTEIVIVRATDTGGLWSQEAINVEVLSVNDPPSFTKGENISVPQQSSAQLYENWATDIQPGPANESNQATSFVILSNNNTGLFATQPSIDVEGTLTFAPSLSEEAFGTAEVLFALVDNGGTENGGVNQSTTDTLYITLSRSNTPPTANNDTYIVDQGQTLQRNADRGVLSNDTDPENDPLTARLISEPENGTITLNADGAFIYRHDNSRTTNDVFSYVANDGMEDSELATVFISILPVGTQVLQEIVVDEDSDSTLVQVRERLSLSNSETFSFEITSISNPALFSKVSIDSLSGLLNIHYAPNANGLSTVNIRATPQNPVDGDPINATQNIRVLPINDPPIAVTDIAATIENNPIEINVLNNDIDFDGDALTISGLFPPSDGTVVLLGEATFLYTPPLDFTGEISFTYLIEDESLEQDEGEVIITIFSGRFGVTSLNIPGVETSAAYGVSNSGEVVGIKETANGLIQAFSSVRDLFSEGPSEASSSNEFGQVVGTTSVPFASSSGAFTWSASRWDSSGVTILGSFDDRTSKAFDINNEGRIVGTSTWASPDVFRAFLWESGQLKALETNSQSESQAYAINEIGQIAGYDGESAVIWNGERILRTLNGTAGRAYGLNDNGQAIGSIDDGIVKAVFWDTDGSRTDLHLEGSAQSEAYGINNSTWIVGSFLPPSTPGASQSANINSNVEAERGSGRLQLPALMSKNQAEKKGLESLSMLSSSSNNNMRAFLWQGDQLVDLNEFIDPNSGWILLEALDINNAAQITGIGLFNGQRRAFLLSPTNNKAPIAQNDIVLLSTIQETAIPVILNDTDLDGDTLRVIEVSQGLHGTVNIQDAQTLLYVPGPQFNGTDTFTYTVIDAQGATDEAIVEIRLDESSVPESFFLDQNYPNPFNPVTVIQYGLAEQSHVRLEVYNLIGQRIATLIDGDRAAGTHSMTFDASHLPGGVYMYRLQTGQFTDTKQLILLK